METLQRHGASGKKASWREFGRPIPFPRLERLAEARKAEILAGPDWERMRICPLEVAGIELALKVSLEAGVFPVEAKIYLWLYPKSVDALICHHGLPLVPSARNLGYRKFPCHGLEWKLNPLFE